MSDIGIMIEGQEDLTWERLFRLAGAVEDLGFESLFRSDHLQPLEVSEPRRTLALWPSLTALALRTQRIRFGPMVSPLTFRHPAIVAKMAASVSELSAGRLDLGLGAGWFPGEHRSFGILYPKFAARQAMLAEGVQVIRAVWSGGPVDFEGQHYRLKGPLNVPGLAGRPPEIIMGGKGERTLEIAAQFADEWNCSYSGLDEFKTYTARLDEKCEQVGRKPGSLRRSIMIPFVIARSEPDLQERIRAQKRTFPTLPGSRQDWLAAGFIGGSPAQVQEQIGAFREAGVARFMLQLNDLDDTDSLELLAEALVS